MDKTAEILFEYLKNTLYYPERAKLDVSELPADFQKLGQGLLLLNDYISENRSFAKALAKGDLSIEPPNVGNILAMPVKELQGSLRHLAWQTQQVAKGDYSQQVDFMGDFSVAFNSMTKQLSERTKSLIQEKQLVEQKNQEMEGMLELLLALTNYTHDMIFVLSEGDGHQVFMNRPAEWFVKVHPEKAEKLQKHLLAHETKKSEESDNWNTNIEPDTELSEMEKQFFAVESFGIKWKAEDVVVHIVVDDTERTKREQLIYSLAYVDPLTGLSNRRYAMNLMKHWIEEKESFLLSFIDVDYLKYCNDTFGHEEGDYYLIRVVNALKTLPGELCRVGGDEFFFLIQGTDVQEREKQLDYVRDLLEKQTDARYPQGFSFATSLVPYPLEETLEKYIKNTDAKMYQYKMKHKKKLEDVIYHDVRV